MLSVFMHSLRWPSLWFKEQDADASDQDVVFRRVVWISAILIGLAAWAGVIWGLVSLIRLAFGHH